MASFPWASGRSGRVGEVTRRQAARSEELGPAGDWDVYAERELKQVAEIQLASDRILAREPGETEARASGMLLLSSPARPLLALTDKQGNSLPLLRLVPLYPGCENDRDEPASLFRKGQTPDSRVGVRPGSGPR